MTAHHGPDGVGGYFARPAERLVLDGSRHWSVEHAAGDSPGEAARLYEEILGKRFSRFALDALEALVASLATCGACPFRCFPPGTRHVTRDEVLLLGLLSAIQHGDDEMVRLCLRSISCPAGCQRIAAAAERYAVALRLLGQILTPIPATAIEDVLVRSRSVTIH